MGSKGGATTTSSSAPPQMVQDMYKYIMDAGKSLQQKPYESYSGELVPGMNATQQAGVDQAQKYSEAAQPYYQKAGQMTQDVYSGYNPQNYAAGVSSYMSPYMQQAMGATAAQLNNVNQQQQNQLLGNTVQQGAFGGDRGKIAQAALMGQQNLSLGNVMSNMANTGYNAAATNYLSGLQQQGNMANQYGNLGTSVQQQGMAGAQGLMTAGAVPYAVQQAKDAAQYQQWAQGQAYPWQTLGSLANMASGLGAGQGGMSSTTSPGPNSMNSWLGLGTALLGMSDERTKENIEPVGKTYDGQNIYKFNYKGDPKTNIGLIAQEVEKHNPSAVHKTEGGLRMVDYDAATENAAERGHFAMGGSSMGGLVSAGMDRQPFAKGGYGLVPYADDPLLAFMEERSSIPMIAYIPEINIKGGGVGIPDAPKPYEDKPYDTSGIEGFGKALYGKYGPASIPDRGIKVGDVANLYSSPIGPMPEYAQGGLVSRSHHASGDTPPKENEVPSDQGFLGNLGSSISKGISGLVSSKDQPGLIGNLFNKGEPLSDDARQAIMAAGLGIMASPSPFLAQAIGQGGLTGMNTYAKQKQINYETQKALAEQALRGREIAVSEAGLPLRSAQLGMDAYTQKMAALAALQQRAKGYLATPGGRVPENIQQSIDGLLRDLQAGPPIIPGVKMPSLPTAKPTVGQQSSLEGDGTTLVPPTGSPAVPKGVKVPGQQDVSSADVPAKGGANAAAKVEAAQNGFELPEALDPDILLRDAEEAAKSGYGDVALEKQNRAKEITNEITHSGGLMVHGQFVPLPNYAETMAQREAMKKEAEQKIASKYEMVEVQKPDGTTVLKRKSDLLPQEKEVSPGAGSPPGQADAVATPDVVKKLPEYVLKQREAIMTDENKMRDDFMKRQIATSRIDGLLNILTKYETGSFEDQKTQLAKDFYALGISVPAENMRNATSFEQFTKGAIQQVFDSLPGGKILLSEIQGLSKANANPGMLPASNAKILGDARALINWENKYAKDYMAWREANPNAYDPNQVNKFAISWAEKPENNLNRFKAEETRKIGYKGQQLPNKQEDLQNGQAYYVPDDKSPGVYFWDAKKPDLTKDPSGKILGKWSKTDPLAGG